MKALGVMIATALSIVAVFAPLVADDSPKKRDPEKTQAVWKALLIRLADDRGFTNRTAATVVEAEKVEGTKLYNVQFVRRGAAQENDELIGRADSVELTLDLEKAAIIATGRNLLVRKPVGDKGDLIWVAEFSQTIDLPPDLEALERIAGKLRKVNDLPLSKEERAFFAEGFPVAVKPSPGEEKLALAFGKDCDELSRKAFVFQKRFNVALAFESVSKVADGKMRYSRCSIAVFRKIDGIDTVQASIRDSEVISLDLWSKGIDNAVTTLLFECSNGVLLKVDQR